MLSMVNLGGMSEIGEGRPDTRSSFTATVDAIQKGNAKFTKIDAKEYFLELKSLSPDISGKLVKDAKDFFTLVRSTANDKKSSEKDKVEDLDQVFNTRMGRTGDPRTNSVNMHIGRLGAIMFVGETIISGDDPKAFDTEAARGILEKTKDVRFLSPTEQGILIALALGIEKGFTKEKVENRFERLTKYMTDRAAARWEVPQDGIGDDFIEGLLISNM